jgi:integrase
VNPAKKEKRGRWLPLAMGLCHFLKLYYNRIPQENRTPESRVFPITGTAHEQAWKRIVKRANLFETRENGAPDYFCFHDLRHTAATNFRSKPIGLTADENSYMLGHIDKRMTGIYEHVWDMLVDDIRAKFDIADEDWKPKVKVVLTGGKEYGLLPPDDIAELVAFETAEHPLYRNLPDEWALWQKTTQQYREKKQ